MSVANPKGLAAHPCAKCCVAGQPQAFRFAYSILAAPSLAAPSSSMPAAAASLCMAVSAHADTALIALGVGCIAQPTIACAAAIQARVVRGTWRNLTVRQLKTIFNKEPGSNGCSQWDQEQNANLICLLLLLEHVWRQQWIAKENGKTGKCRPVMVEGVSTIASA